MVSLSVSSTNGKKKTEVISIINAEETRDGFT